MKHLFGYIFVYTYRNNAIFNPTETLSAFNIFHTFQPVIDVILSMWASTSRQLQLCAKQSEGTLELCLTRKLEIFLAIVNSSISQRVRIDCKQAYMHPR